MCCLDFRPCKIRIRLQENILRLIEASGERANVDRTQNTVILRARTGSRSRSKRNKWRGPTVGGEQAVYAELELELELLSRLSGPSLQFVMLAKQLVSE